MVLCVQSRPALYTTDHLHGNINILAPLHMSFFSLLPTVPGWPLLTKLYIHSTGSAGKPSRPMQAKLYIHFKGSPGSQCRVKWAKSALYRAGPCRQNSKYIAGSAGSPCRVKWARSALYRAGPCRQNSKYIPKAVQREPRN